MSFPEYRPRRLRKNELFRRMVRETKLSVDDLIYPLFAVADKGIVQAAVRAIKDAVPGILVLTDICLCEYTDHGHCGILTRDGDVDNDATLDILARSAVTHARAGADMVAPSDMMD